MDGWGGLICVGGGKPGMFGLCGVMFEGGACIVCNADGFGEMLVGGICVGGLCGKLPGNFKLLFELFEYCEFGYPFIILGGCFRVVYHNYHKDRNHYESAKH